MITHSPIHTPLTARPQGAIARLAASFGAAAAAVCQLGHVRRDMRRLAAECAVTRPELAARLRSAASQSWAG